MVFAVDLGLGQAIQHQLWSYAYLHGGSYRVVISTTRFCFQGMVPPPSLPIGTNPLNNLLSSGGVHSCRESIARPEIPCVHRHAILILTQSSRLSRATL